MENDIDKMINVFNEDYLDDDYDEIDLQSNLLRMKYELLANDAKTNKMDFWTFSEAVAEINELDSEFALINLLINLENKEASVLKCPAMQELKAEILEKSFLSIECKCNEILSDFYKTISIEEENYTKDALKFLLVILNDKKYRKKATAAYLLYHKDILKMISTNDDQKNVENLHFLFEESDLCETDYLYIYWFNKQYFEAAVLLSFLIKRVVLEESNPVIDGEILTEQVKEYRQYLMEFNDTTPFLLFLESYLSHIGKQSTYMENIFTDKTLDAVISLYLYACVEYYGIGAERLDAQLIGEELVEVLAVANVLSKIVTDEISIRTDIEQSNKDKYEEIINEKDREINELKEKLSETEAHNKRLNTEMDRFNERLKNELYKKEKEVRAINYDEINNLNEQLIGAQERITKLLDERMELNRLREFAYSVTEGSVNENVEEKWEDIAGDKKILMFGGHIKMLQRIKEKHNNVDSVPILDISTFNAEIVKRYDLICINTNFMNHGAYYKLINACETYKVDFIYLGNENIEKIEKEIMKRFKE